MSLSRKERERMTRESEILSAAEKLFTGKGFENTTMEEIAKESEFTKRTVYQYFGSKENLFYAVILSGIKQMFSYIEAEVEAGKDGFDKLTGTRRAFYRFVKDYPDIYRFMSYAQYIKSDPASIPNFRELSQYNTRLFTLFQQLAEEGVADGSIRADLDIPLGIYALYFLTTGFMNRYSEAGTAFSRTFKFDPEELVRKAFDMLDQLLGNGKG
jgi:AcrR family transcriptional regulator